VATILLLLRGRPPAARPVRTLAVFPFTVRGSPELGYLREGLVDLLSAKLDGAAGFRAVDPRSVIAAAGHVGEGASATPSASARIARGLGARWFITGELVEVTGRLQITGSLFDADSGNAALATTTVSGRAPDLFQMLDALTGRMLAGLVVGRDTALTKLASITTRSLPALTAFLQGERALRAGLDGEAAAAFREAAALDTGFALALYRLALTATWVSVPGGEDPAVWAEAAARHAERLTPLGRDLLTAYLAYRQGRGEDAERLYRGVIEGHPDNLEAWLMLGETLFHYNPYRGRQALEAWVPFQRVLALDSANAHALIHLARLAATEARLAALDSLAQRYLARYREADRAVEMQALVAAAHGDQRTSDAVAATVRHLDDVVAIGVLQAVLVYAQRFDAAAGLITWFAAPRSSPSPTLRYGRRMLSDVGLYTGRWGRQPGARPLATVTDDAWLLESEALAASDPFFAVPRERVTALRDSIAARRPYPAQTPVTQRPGPELDAAVQDYLLGLLSSRLGDLAAARRYAAHLGAVRAGGNETSAVPGLAVGLRAEIARSSGDLRTALATIENFPFDAWWTSHLTHFGVHERFLRAEILHALGREDEALAWYDSFIGWPDLPWIAAAHYRRGEIEARLGHPEHARFHYTRFVRLWKDCDPEFQPLLHRASEALAQLGGASETTP
jgi:TolB-like protein/tetratricopeptide (TPR) repeat protein